MTGRGDHPAGTLGSLLATRRHRSFVGRQAELELLTAALEQAEPAFRVLYVHGPGGIGKSALVEEYGELAVRHGVRVARLDGRELAAAPGDAPQALDEVLRTATGGEAVAAGERAVLLVDGYHLFAALDAWVREALVPRLPASAVVVIADRLPPAPEWRADPAWAELLRVVSLRNLDPESAAEYLRRRGVPDARRPEVLAAAYGHPLTLSLVVDVLERDPEADLGALPADLVSGLLQRLVSTVPSAAHRRALEVSSLARATTESLLRDVVGEEEAHEVFRWLSGLSVTEDGAEGVRPHDLVRDLLDADLRWRDPDGYREVFRAVRASALRRVRSTAGRPQQRAAADLKFLFRHLRSVLSPVAWDSWGDHFPDQVRDHADRETVIDLVASAEGEQTARLAERWLDRQPDGFAVIRRTDGSVRGVVALLDLTAASAEDRAEDPATAAAWSYVERAGPVRPGEAVTQCRFVVDAEAYQGPCPTMNAVPILTLQRQLCTPHLAWDFLTLADPDRWTAYFAAADLPRAEGADFELGGRRFGLFAHDFRRVPMEVMTERWTERALADDALLMPPQTAEPERLVLSYVDFAAAVRQAVRDLHQRELLAVNPLLRTPLVAPREGETGVQALQRLVRSTADSLAGDARTVRLHEALDSTYLRASRTQEAAAAALGVPFSTYRRHLRQGVDAVVSRLWQQELGVSGGER